MTRDLYWAGVFAAYATANLGFFFLHENGSWMNAVAGFLCLCLAVFVVWEYSEEVKHGE
jgi:hypothetical protein